jgi:hypothetical protein
MRRKAEEISKTGLRGKGQSKAGIETAGGTPSPAPFLFSLNFAASAQRNRESELTFSG